MRRKSLRAVRDYPNNTLVVDLKLVGSPCTIKIENRLKTRQTTVVHLHHASSAVLDLSGHGSPPTILNAELNAE
jgi:hypothetical protein